MHATLRFLKESQRIYFIRHQTRFRIAYIEITYSLVILSWKHTTTWYWINFSIFNPNLNKPNPNVRLNCNGFRVSWPQIGTTAIKNDCTVLLLDRYFRTWKAVLQFQSWGRTPEWEVYCFTTSFLSLSQPFSAPVESQASCIPTIA